MMIFTGNVPLGIYVLEIQGLFHHSVLWYWFFIFIISVFHYLPTAYNHKTIIIFSV